MTQPLESPPGARAEGPPTTGFGTTGFGPTGFGDLPAPGGARAGSAPASAFDVCHVGVVLRAVLGVHAVVALGVAFGAETARAWLLSFASGSAVALPGVLLWLVLACGAKRVFGRLPRAGQWVVAVALGAVAGLFGWAQTSWTGLAGSGARNPWAPMLAGAGLSLVLFYWLRVRLQERSPADAAARLAELQSRIRPHFLFNTLNTAIALVRVDPARAETILEDLAELFRVALAETGEAVTLDQEIALAQRYLEIEKVRFGARLQVHWELDPLAGAAAVPPLLLQPLVENAVRHGVEPSAEGGSVRVRTQVRRGHAVITVVNSVPPGGSRPGHGMALDNVRQRLLLMHDVAAQFSTRAENGLFRAQVVVPLKST